MDHRRRRRSWRDEENRTTVAETRAGGAAVAETTGGATPIARIKRKIERRGASAVERAPGVVPARVDADLV